jgi:predicted RND superfamily exporter protein
MVLRKSSIILDDTYLQSLVTLTLFKKRKIVLFIIVLLISFSTYSQKEEKFYEEGKLHLKKKKFHYIKLKKIKKQ